MKVTTLPAASERLLTASATMATEPVNRPEHSLTANSSTLAPMPTFPASAPQRVRTSGCLGSPPERIWLIRVCIMGKQSFGKMSMLYYSISGKDASREAGGSGEKSFGEFTIRSQERHDLSLFFGYYIDVPSKYNTNTSHFSLSFTTHTGTAPRPQRLGRCVVCVPERSKDSWRAGKCLQIVHNRFMIWS